MEIVIGDYKLKRHNQYCWELFEWRAARPHHMNGGVEGEPKWMTTGRYPSTLALALQDVYELELKFEPGVYELKDALAAAKRIERSIERAAKDALAKEEQ